MADHSKPADLQPPVYVEAYALPVDASAPSAPPSFNPAVTAPPIAPAESSTGVPPPQSINYPGTHEYLSTRNWPTGLRDTFLKNLLRVPLRFFICDDSGSMATNDGHKLIRSGNNAHLQPCSRWSELTESLNFHAGLAQAANAKSEFRLLNGAAPLIIGDSENDPDGCNIATLRTIFEGGPGGGTPLCRHIREVIAEIAAVAPALRTANQRACVIIATDGEASDGDLAAALRPLHDLPCFVVVRLCTDEDNIVNYWNGIDNDLELQMDVLDDLTSEAKEVHHKNPWLNYCDELHKMREFGCSQRDFDLLDESSLSLDQARNVCMLIFGGQSSAWPQPEADWEKFEAAVKAGLAAAHPAWNPYYREMQPWVDVHALGKLRPGHHGGGCTIV